jgi:hypothetical protein
MHNNSKKNTSCRILSAASAVEAIGVSAGMKTTVANSSDFYRSTRNDRKIKYEVVEEQETIPNHSDFFYRTFLLFFTFMSSLLFLGGLGSHEPHDTGSSQPV